MTFLQKKHGCSTSMWQCVKTLYPCSSHQNSWDLWMFIPLKMVLIGIDPYPCEFTLVASPGALRFLDQRHATRIISERFPASAWKIGQWEVSSAHLCVFENMGNALYWLVVSLHFQTNPVNLIGYNSTTSGWWYTYPSEKCESQLRWWDSQYDGKNKTGSKPPTSICPYIPH